MKNTSNRKYQYTKVKCRASVQARQQYLLVQILPQKMAAASVMTTGRSRLPTCGAMRMKMKKNRNNVLSLYNYASP